MANAPKTTTTKGPSVPQKKPVAAPAQAAPAQKAAPAFKKTVCPITRKQFNEVAKRLPITLGEGDSKVSLKPSPKNFSTGSLGWFEGGKAEIDLGDGTLVTCQLSLNITIVGSKELPPLESEEDEVDEEAEQDGE